MTPAIKKFLAERGLALSSEKTKTYNLRNSALNYLGYTFQHKDQWKANKSIIYSNIKTNGVALYPNKVKVMELISRIREIFRTSQNVTSYSVLTELNPIISGWARYYDMANSSRYRERLRQALYSFCWKWCQKKHPRWGKKVIAETYFKSKTTDGRSIKIKKRAWTFKGITKTNSRYNDSKTGKTTYLQDPTTFAILPAKDYIIPQTMINTHAFSEDYMKLVNLAANTSMKSTGINATLKEK